LLTRLSADAELPADSLYGFTIDGLRFDALPVDHDRHAWTRQFLDSWPPDTLRVS
jgi:hypothetical protein